jgi:hypothetical protein
MHGNEFLIVMIIGGVFILLGILVFFWGRQEENSYLGSVSHRIDVREFLEHIPGRPEPAALRIGGKISVLLGIIIILFALGFHFWG